MYLLNKTQIHGDQWHKQEMHILATMSWTGIVLLNKFSPLIIVCDFLVKLKSASIVFSRINCNVVGFTIECNGWLNQIKNPTKTLVMW